MLRPTYWSTRKHIINQCRIIEKEILYSKSEHILARITWGENHLKDLVSYSKRWNMMDQKISVFWYPPAIFLKKNSVGDALDVYAKYLNELKRMGQHFVRVKKMLSRILKDKSECSLLQRYIRKHKLSDEFYQPVMHFAKFHPYSNKIIHKLRTRDRNADITYRKLIPQYCSGFIDKIA